MTEQELTALAKRTAKWKHYAYIPDLAKGYLALLAERDELRAVVREATIETALTGHLWFSYLVGEGSIHELRSVHVCCYCGVPWRKGKNEQCPGYKEEPDITVGGKPWTKEQVAEMMDIAMRSDLQNAREFLESNGFTVSGRQG